MLQENENMYCLCLSFRKTFISSPWQSLYAIFHHFSHGNDSARWPHKFKPQNSQIPGLSRGGRLRGDQRRLSSEVKGLEKHAFINRSSLYHNSCDSPYPCSLIVVSSSKRGTLATGRGRPSISAL